MSGTHSKTVADAKRSMPDLVPIPYAPRTMSEEKREPAREQEELMTLGRKLDQDCEQIGRAGARIMQLAGGAKLVSPVQGDATRLLSCK